MTMTDRVTNVEAYLWCDDDGNCFIAYFGKYVFRFGPWEWYSLL